VFNQRWLTKKNIVNFFSFFPEDLTFMILHKLLQSIIRSKRNRRKLFNSKKFIRQFIFIRSFSKLRKIRLIRFSIKFSHSLLQSITTPQVFKKGLPKIIGQVLLGSVPSIRKLVGYLVLPHRTSTSQTIPIGEIVALLAS
jgi:hypothetical protein